MAEQPVKMEPVIDLTHVRGDTALLVEEPERYVKIGCPVNTHIDHIQLERVGIDLFAIPTLLRRWANVIESQLVAGEPPETVEDPEDHAETENLPMAGARRAEPVGAGAAGR